jgi:molybdopterin-guanine dinucleotide biosynthesis protein A
LSLFVKLYRKGLKRYYNQSMLSVVIQAGGVSRRMGQDKALMPFLGKPLIVRIVQRLSGLGEELIVVTNRPEEYAFLGLPLVTDIIPGRGALGGLYTALKVAKNPVIAMAACDMPFINRDLLAYQRDLLEKDRFDAVIPKTDFGTEPLHAVYERASCLSKVEAVLNEGSWRLDSWFPQAKIHFLLTEEILRFDPRLIVFQNLNTPEDLREAEKLAAED